MTHIIPPLCHSKFTFQSSITLHKNHILSECCVPTSFSIIFLKVVHLVIYSPEHKVQDHHRIQTQTTHREGVIIFLTNREARQLDIPII